MSIKNTANLRNNQKWPRNPKKLQEYDSLKDKNLGHFFSKPRVFCHLCKMGLITPDGQIISERDWRDRNRKTEIVNQGTQSTEDQMFETRLSMDFYRSSDCLSSSKSFRGSRVSSSSTDYIFDCETEDEQLKLIPNYDNVPKVPLTSIGLEGNEELIRSSNNMRYQTGSQADNSRNLKLTSTRSTNNKNRQSGPKVRRNFARKRDVVPMSLDGEPYLDSVLTSAREMVMDSQKSESLQKRGYQLQKRVNVDDEMSATLRLEYLGPTGEVKIVQRPQPNTSYTVFSNSLQTKDVFSINVKRNPHGSLGLVIAYADNLVMRLNGCCERRYSPGKLIDGPSGRLRLLLVDGDNKPCDQLSSRATDPQLSRKKL